MRYIQLTCFFSVHLSACLFFIHLLGYLCDNYLIFVWSVNDYVFIWLYDLVIVREVKVENIDYCHSFP